MRILITGSNGYIGSVLGNYLISKKFNIIGIDKKNNNKFINFKQLKCDLNNTHKLIKILEKYKPGKIIHLAGESTIDNIFNKKNYIINNIKATKNLLDICKKQKIKDIIFSSTAAVYKQTNKKIKESYIKKPNNIYGITKLKAENLIKKYSTYYNLNYIIFRFFNVCSSLKGIGENHNPETHLIPIAVQKFIDKKELIIYGQNFNTKDGSCIRDYIHIKDLCIAFYRALKLLDDNKKKQIHKIINLGSNNGISVLQIINFFKKKLSYKISKRRKGDKAILICNNNLAFKILKWKPLNSHIKKIIQDEIKWYNYLKKKKILRKTKY